MSVQATLNYYPVTLSSLKDRSGDTIHAAIAGSSGTGVTDSNGNEITYSTSGSTTTYTDTLGKPLTVTTTGSPVTSVTYQYTGASTGTETYTVKYQPYTIETNFGCSGISEYGPTSQNLPYEIDLPDIGTNSSDKYTISYELTPGSLVYYTGRIASITLPTGGMISYAYSGGSNGITCADGSTATLTRTTPDGTWTYAHTESGSYWTTTVTDPQGNYTWLYFQEDYKTQRLAASGHYEVDTCYNGAAKPCTTTSITLPITRVTTWKKFDDNVTSEVDTTINSIGLPTDVKEYDFGLALLRETVTAYASLGNNILDRPSTVTIKNGSGGTVASTTYGYDGSGVVSTSGVPQHVSVTGSRGNLTSATLNSLTKSYTYFDTGNVDVATDVNSAQVTYAYSGTGGCASAFPTSITSNTISSALSQTLQWNCDGGVILSVADVNGATTSYSYSGGYFNLPTSVTDPSGATTYINDTPTSGEGYMDFGSTSTVDSLVTVDGLGRPHVSQRAQSSARSTYDSTETDYDSLGRPYRVSVPYSGSGGYAGGTNWTTTTYDAINRPLTVTDAGGGEVKFTYSSNDVLRNLTDTSNSSSKEVQYQYDGLGRLSSVCEVTSASGSGACSQVTAANGFFTSYTYDALNDLTGVSQSGQTRSYTYDSMGRLTQEVNPESGTTTYAYDSDSTCGTSHGDLVKKVDAVGNVTCFQYDGLHRLTKAYLTSSSPYYSATPDKYYVYDAATVNGQAMANAGGRLAETYTCPAAGGGSCSSKLTDIGYSYSPRGEIADTYESTPNSGGYYHVSGTYWANGLLDILNLKNASGTALIPQVTYNPDGEGQVNSTSIGSGQNPLTGTNYNIFGEPTSVSLGSSDSDSFQYDSNTGRMTQYKFTVNGSSVTGNLGWNANGTLASLGITDPFDSSNQQSCTYGYDDLARINSANCGTVWDENFSADMFSNLSKTAISGATRPIRPPPIESLWWAVTSPLTTPTAI